MPGMSGCLQETKRPPLFGFPLTKKPPAFKSFHFHTTIKKQIPFQSAQKGEDTDSQAQHYISLIEDPLWKYVCKEVVHIMGPTSALKLWDIRLGDLSPHDQEAHLYCSTEEIVQFVQQYAFIFMGALHNYFPNIRNLIIIVR